MLGALLLLGILWIIVFVSVATVSPMASAGPSPARRAARLASLVTLWWLGWVLVAWLVPDLFEAIAGGFVLYVAVRWAYRWHRRQQTAAQVQWTEDAL